MVLQPVASTDRVYARALPAGGLKAAEFAPTKQAILGIVSAPGGFRAPAASVGCPQVPAGPQAKQSTHSKYELRTFTARPIPRWVYPDRIAGSDQHYRRPGQHGVAGAEPGQGESAGRQSYDGNQ